jgi:hypothetical protein
MGRLNHWPRRGWVRNILRRERVRPFFSLSTASPARVVPSTSIVPWRHNDTSEVWKIRHSPEIIEGVMSKIGN